MFLSVMTGWEESMASGLVWFSDGVWVFAAFNSTGYIRNGYG